MKYISILTLLFLSVFNVHSANINNNFKECEKAIETKLSKSIVKDCMSLVANSQKAKLYIIAGELFQHISYERINEIFDFGEAEPLYSTLVYKKKLYSNIEKYYLKEAYKKLSKYSDIDIGFINLLFLKIAYINVLYFQVGEMDIVNPTIIELEKNFKSEIYIPLLEKYLHDNPSDKEVLYLLGMQGLQVTFPPNPKPMLLYNKVVNQKLFKYLKKSASLGFYKAKVSLITVSNWEKYILELNKAASSNDKDALYKIGMQNYNNYIDSNFKNLDFLDKAIIDFEKAQELGHKDAINTLISIYYRDKPNKQNYTKLLKKMVNKYEDGFLSLGNLFWCNGDKIKAKEMYVRARNKGGINISEAKYALEDLTKLDEPYDGCRFKK